MPGLGAGFVGTVALAAPALALAEPSAASPSASVLRLIAAAKAEGVFVDASAGAQARVRHLASGLVCRFDPADPSAAIAVLPSRVRGDNVGCTSRLGSGRLSLQAQRLGPSVDASRFLADMVEVVRTDFAVAEPIASPSPASGPGARAQFKAVFQGRPVYVEVSAVRVGAWMVSGRLVAPFQDAQTADRTAEAEIHAAAQEVVREAR